MLLNVYSSAPASAAAFSSRISLWACFMSETENNTLTFMMASLKEVQDTVRAYDTKAQIVGVGYILTSGIIVSLGARISSIPEVNSLEVAFAWLFFILPIVLFGAVLYPSRKVAPSISEQDSHPHGTYYVDPEHIHGLDTYLEAIDAGNPKLEIAYEILKTAGLREIKRRRFLRALWAAVMSFMFLFLFQALRAEGVLPI